MSSPRTRQSNLISDSPPLSFIRKASFRASFLSSTRAARLWAANRDAAKVGGLISAIFGGFRTSGIASLVGIIVGVIIGRGLPHMPTTSRSISIDAFD